MLVKGFASLQLENVVITESEHSNSLNEKVREAVYNTEPYKTSNFVVF